MKKAFPLSEIQKYIKKEKLDGWLLFDFHGKNTIAVDLLQINQEQLLSRRFYYWIPKSGSPLKIVHEIENHTLSHLPGKELTYESWQSLDEALKKMLKGKKKIAMEHSPAGSVPVISKLDSGTYELLKNQGIDVVSSWNVAQFFISRWNKSEFSMHKFAAKTCVAAYKSAWKLIKESLLNKKKITEYDVQLHLLECFDKAGCITDHDPIVAVDAHASLPHYNPTKERSSTIKEGQLLLIDLWAKKDKPHSTYSDLTQVAYVGKKAPQKLEELYTIVYDAQQKAIDYLKKQLAKKKLVKGYELDDISRKHIEDAGYSKYFVHRTGHNIHTELHGLGPSLDNFETHDDRIMQPRTCYSIEPGIYLPNSHGIRLECNIFIDEDLNLVETAKSYSKLPCIL